MRGGRSVPIGRRPIGPGSQPRLTKKIQMSTRPIQNCGSAMPPNVTPRTRKSGHRSRLTAASTPSGTPAAMPMQSPTRPSSSVAGKRSVRSRATFWPVLKEVPRSPCSRAPI